MVTTLITRGVLGTPANDNSFLGLDVTTGDLLGGTVLNDTGNLIVFTTDASNLDGGTDNNVQNVYLYNKTTRNFRNFTRGAFGRFANQPSRNPSISGDGQKVVLESLYPEFSTTTGNRVRNIYLVENLEATTPSFTLITDNYTQDSFNPSISGDGNWVVFETLSSRSTNTADSSDNDRDIILYNLTNRQSIWVSQRNGNQGDPSVTGDSTHASVSENGRYVVFQSDIAANELLSSVNDENGGSDIFLYDRDNNSLRLISKRFQGGTVTTGNGESVNPSISRDGRFIVYESESNNLVNGTQNNSVKNIFFYDIGKDETRKISLRFNGNETTEDSFSPTLNANGTYIAFASDDPSLVRNDTNQVTDVFLWQRSNGNLSRVSVASNGSQANNTSTNPSIGPQGNQIAFQSLATNLGGLVQEGKTNIFSAELDLLVDPVYRFYNPASRGHFFTISTIERDTVLNNPQWGYQFENIGFYASATPIENSLPVYRFYNPVSRGHFFTINTAERDNVINHPEWGYQFENVGFYAYGIGSNLAANIYRFYNPISQGHFFTVSPAERDIVLSNTQWGYQFEGVGFEAGVI